MYTSWTRCSNKYHKSTGYSKEERSGNQMQIMRSTDYVGALTVRKTNAGKP